MIFRAAFQHPAECTPAAACRPPPLLPPPQTPDTELEATRHVFFIMNGIVSLTLYLLLRGAKNTKLALPSPLTGDVALTLGCLFTCSSRPAQKPHALVSSASVTGPSLLSHQFTDTLTYTEGAGARSGAPGRAHALCAHCSAAADVWWP